MDIQKFAENWIRHYPLGRLPICNEMKPNGNFVYEMNGVAIGFAFGSAGRPISCYWLESLEKYLCMPDASNQYVSQEKLNSLIQSGQS